MLNIVIIVVALALGSYLALSRRLTVSSNWKATVTPLSSIMGSGFLVSAPLLVTIGGIGMWRGLGKLESVEKFAVSLNLGMIGALLVGLATYNVQLVLGGNWALPAISSSIDFHDLRVLLGLLIVVQGFETSRYLGDEHPADQRIATMRAAQLMSTGIYLVFIALATVLFHDGLGSDVTAIIGMTKPVAVVLPLLLSIAAIGSQFSASVADSAGAGGLMEDITHRKLSIRYAYLLILVVTVALTWETNVNEIIAYASRAFALYYTLQCVVAFVVAWQQKEIKHRTLRLGMFASLALICLLVFGLGIPSG
jgi:hypothetical protein